MAGQRYSHLQIGSLTPVPTEELSIWLAGAYRVFRAVAPTGQPQQDGEFPVVAYNGPGGNAGAREYNTQQLAAEIRRVLGLLGADQQYSVVDSFNTAFGYGLVDITATAYDPAFDFEPLLTPGTSAGINYNEALREDVIKPLTVTPTVVIATCFDSATARIDLAVSNGTGSYTYEWADGPTTPDRTGLSAGTYTVTVRDVSGAYEVVAVPVGQNSRINVFIATTDGEVRLTVSGGTPGYTYLWSDGSTTGDRAGLAAGNYTVTVTDSLGCTQTVPVVIELNSFHFAGNPILLALDAGDAYRDDPTTKPNLTFCCEVYVEAEYLSGNFRALGTLIEQPADRDGRTTFEVQELLAPFLDYHVPDPAQRGVVRATPLFRRFYLEYYEKFGTPAAAAPATTQAQHYALLGGLDFYESQARTWFNGYQAGVMPFFTWEPDNKLVALDQPEYLYFMATKVFLFTHVRVSYDDGTSSTRLMGTVNAQRYELHCWAVGWAALGLADLPTARVVAWEVWVSDGSANQTQVRRFVVDRRPVPQRRYLLFATSLGGMATWPVTGEAQLDLEVSGSEAEYPLPPGYNPARGDTVVQDRQLRPVLRLASGLRTRAQMKALTEVLLSRCVRLLSGETWLPGYLKAKTTRLADDGNDLPTVELDFYLPRQSYFTPRLPVVPAGLPVAAITAADTLLP